MGIHFRNKKKRPAISLLAAISVRGGPLLLMPARGGTVILELAAIFARPDDDICPPAKAEIKDFHSRGQIPKAQKKNPWPLNARKLVYNNNFIISEADN